MHNENNQNLFFPKISTTSFPYTYHADRINHLFQNGLLYITVVYILKIFIQRHNYTNKVQVCRIRNRSRSRSRNFLKSDADPDQKQIILDPQPWKYLEIIRLFIIVDNFCCSVLTSLRTVVYNPFERLRNNYPFFISQPHSLHAF
jgi:hypothetical protein